MKRLNNLYSKICTIQNIELADENARKNKNNYGIIKHDKHRKKDNILLLNSLLNLTYETSNYSKFKIFEPKERIIYRLPYYPDRITHWAIMNIMESIWTSIFIQNTFSCIKNRGIHLLVKRLSKLLKTKEKETKYCLKLDIKKFYPSIKHEILKNIIRKKIKDKKLLIILDEIIDSTEGVPIGNYLSQFFANLYLAYFDHWLLEEVKVKYYFRYADDIIILSNNKNFLIHVFIAIKFYFSEILYIEIKSNFQIFKVADRGIDFIGYKFFHTHILLRKRIKKKLFKLLNKYYNNKILENKFKSRLYSYSGWLKYCNSKHLLQTIEKYTNKHLSNWRGKLIKISDFYNKNIRIIEIIKHKKYYQIHFIYKDISFSANSRNKILYNKIINSKNLLNFKLKKYVNSKQNQNRH